MYIVSVVYLPMANWPVGAVYFRFMLHYIQHIQTISQTKTKPQSRLFRTGPFKMQVGSTANAVYIT